MKKAESRKKMGKSERFFELVAPQKIADELLFQTDESRFTREYCDKVWTSIVGLIKGLLADDIKPLVPAIGRNGLQCYNLSALAQRFLYRFPDMVDLVSRLSDRNQYDEYLELFRSCCEEMDLYRSALVKNKELWCLRVFTEVLEQESVPCALLFNGMADFIRRGGRLRKTKQKYQERVRDSKDVLKSCSEYFNTLSKLYPRLLAIRVDLFYQKMVGIPPDMEDLDRDFSRLLANSRSNKTVFGGKIGHVAKLEYGVFKGPHLHLVMFFDGAKRDPRAHWHLARSLGEYWKKVATKGQGEYYNCHSDYAEFERRGVCGIGLLHRDDEIKKNNFRKHILRYLCKVSSFARPRRFPEMRLIRKGEITPKMRYRRDRPRKEKPPCMLEILKEQIDHERRALSKREENNHLLPPIDPCRLLDLNGHLSADTNELSDVVSSSSEC